MTAPITMYICFIAPILQHRYKGWSYCGVYADEAKTGTKDTRENFQRMIAACRAGEIDIIITKSIARFARNTVDLLEVVRELKLLGIGVYFEEQRIYTLSGEGELMLSILASYAQEESRSASENQKWRIRKDFEQGKIVSLRHQFGYNIKKGVIEINETLAVIVNEIFDRVIDGESYNAIARDLVERGITCTLGGKWTASRISAIITNEKYIGDALQQKTFVNNHLEKKKIKNKGELPMYYAEGTHPAIIDKERFEKAQEIHRQRKERYTKNRKPTQEVSVFKGLIRCGNCGKTYKRTTNNKTHGWNCSTYIKEGKAVCHAKKIPEQALRKAVCEVLNLTEFSEAAVSEKIIQIIVPGHNRITFHLTDGRTVETEWQDHSRRDSWTPEMKEQARRRALEKNGGTNKWQEQ